MNGQIKISQTSVSTVKMDYQYLPADKATDSSEDSDVEPIEDITPIGLLALGMWYLSSRQGAGKYQLFSDQYKAELREAIIKDAGSRPIRKFNRPPVMESGYRGRR